jgi:hypothetical protein
MIQFLNMHVLSHLKFFDAKLQDWEEANYYFEREWRISQDVKFRLNDLWRVILPPGMKPLEWKRDMIDRAVKRPTSLSKPRSDVHLDENSGCRGSESDISQKHRIPSASVTLAIPANFILRTTLHWQVCVASPDNHRAWIALHRNKRVLQLEENSSYTFDFHEEAMSVKHIFHAAIRASVGTPAKSDGSLWIKLKNFCVETPNRAVYALFWAISMVGIGAPSIRPKALRLPPSSRIATFSLTPSSLLSPPLHPPFSVLAQKRRCVSAPRWP